MDYSTNPVDRLSTKRPRLTRKLPQALPVCHSYVVTIVGLLILPFLMDVGAVGERPGFSYPYPLLILGTLAVGVIIKGASANKSAFVIANCTAGIKGLPSVINAALVTSATSSRALHSLALVRYAPRFFAKTLKNGLPLPDLVASALFSSLAYVSLGSERSEHRPDLPTQPLSTTSAVIVPGAVPTTPLADITFTAGTSGSTALLSLSSATDSLTVYNSTNTAIATVARMLNRGNLSLAQPSLPGRSFNSLAQANKAAQETQTGSDAASSGAAVGASGATAAAQKLLETKKEGRTGGGGGFWMRTKRNRGKSGSGADADNSFDEDDDDEEDEEDEGHDPRSNGKPPGAGNNNNSAGSGSMWSGFKNVVGGLRPNAARRIVGRERNVADDGSVGHGLDEEDDDTAPKQSGFEVVRKPRRSPVVQPSGPPQPGPSTATNAVATASSSSGVGATSTQPQPQAAAAAATGTGTAASASPVGDGSLPPLTDLGRLNAGLGLDFTASLASSDSAGTPRGSLLTAAQHAAFGQTATTTTVPAPVTSSDAESGSERKPASDDPNFWRT
ncbi:hypothetical protein CF326_g7512 [Tilletia indica]|nr:hypothetical protein CF326_g7512 [Tilletia indica]